MLPSHSSNNHHPQSNGFDHQDVPNLNLSKESVDHTFLENLEITSVTTSPFEDVDHGKHKSAREEYLERYSGRFPTATNKKV